ncbi:hypothetical protein FEM48_Zijuj05G0021900 [Ziziphus jujuba var. spinosa]|uniref:Uncharacterized protein n=1 Tax=Ziziphus jujuba var. spinosa TaxID=714518 RepID=A0A978VC76_ZIZJJ|nr:hypothetical protein FEM48_Zijuj05G0021900 [Ziziphus jujuba var. spinosa]
MENWKQWFPVETNNGMEGFPQLKELVVRRCRKLKGKLPHIPSMLSKLVVDDCPELVVSIPRNQMLCELDIENCKEAVYEDEADIMSLRSINISPAAEFQYQAEGFMQGLRRLKDLKISYSEGFMKVLEEVGFPPNLSSLTIRNLKVCKPLLQWGLHRVTSLRELHLSGEATDMVSFPPEPEEEEEKEEENVDDELQGKMMLPNSLTTLNIESFKNLDRKDVL